METPKYRVIRTVVGEPSCEQERELFERLGVKPGWTRETWINETPAPWSPESETDPTEE